MIEKLREVIESQHNALMSSGDLVIQLSKEKNAAYVERNQLVAALVAWAEYEYCESASAGHPWAWRGLHPESDTKWDADWRNIVFVRFPTTGQMSWHIHDSELPMFEHLPVGEGKYFHWDGHTTAEKYERLAKLGIHA